jgi:hypothetical protein
MTKGSYRAYQFTGPQSDGFGQIAMVIQDRKEASTTGATYNGSASVRTCQPASAWSDDVVSGSSILRVAGVVPTNHGVVGTMTLGIDGWEVGQSLLSSLDTYLRSDVAPVQTPASVTFRGFEDVKVPAGTFKGTMKIDFSLVIDDPLSDLDFSITRTQWYARNVGLVKSIGTGGSGVFQQYQETLELTDYGKLPSPPPQLLTISPTGSPVDQATEVTLTGEDFSSGAQVTFGPWPAASVTVESPTVIRAVTPTHIAPFGTSPSAGTYDLMVTTADCQVSLLEDAFTFQ